MTPDGDRSTKPSKQQNAPRPELPPPAEVDRAMGAFVTCVKLVAVRSRRQCVAVGLLAFVTCVKLAAVRSARRPT